MSVGFIILIGIIIAMVAMVCYMAADILRQYKAQIKHIVECRRHYHAKDALAIDYWRVGDRDVFRLDDHRQWMDRTMRWVPKGDYIEEPYEDLYRSGYLRGEKWMSQLRYIGIPVFVKLHNFHIIDPLTMDEEAVGHRRNKLTTSILYNVYKARTLKKAIAGFSRIRYAEMDVKALAFLIPIIIGIAIAVGYFYMKGGF